MTATSILEEGELYTGADLDYAFLSGSNLSDHDSAPVLQSFSDDGSFATYLGTSQVIAEDDDDTLSPSRKSSVRLHAHHGTNASSDAAGKVRKHHCCFPNCGKEFSTSGHLARHNRIHTGEKNYACAECGARFSRQDNCNQHAKSHGKLSRKGSLTSRRMDRAHDAPEAGDSALDARRQHHAALFDASRQLGRPLPSHSVSYAGSLVTSEAGYASSSNDCDPSPSLTGQYEVGRPVHFAELPQSLFDQILDAPPPLVYDSSAAETDESYQSFHHGNNNNNNDFISEEDFYSWSAGVLYTGAEIPELADRSRDTSRMPSI